MRPSAASIIALLGFLFIAVASPPPAAASAPTILIDGQTIHTDVPPIVVDSRVLVPLRGVFEKFGAMVDYDDALRLATATLDDKVVKLVVGSAAASINGERMVLDVPAREFAGRVEVPLRFIAEALGTSVDYDAGSNTVAIVSGKAGHPGGFVAFMSGPTYAAAPRARAAPQVEDMRPEPDSLIGSPYPQIYARFSDGASPVNPSTVRVIFDGTDVSDSATISSAYVSFTPPQALDTGTHRVEITGQADDGTPFSAGWSFRVDVGPVRSNPNAIGAGGFGTPVGFDGFFPGFDGFFPRFNGFFPRFGFFPPGFSVFVPGTIVFFAGNVIEVIFFNQFFPFGNGFFTIDGFPGIFSLVPWTGFPGFFWGTATVPFGVHVSNAIVSAHFKSSSGQKFIVHSTAPITIDGTRTKAPSTLRYAVMPILVNHPSSPRRLVIFKRFEHPTTMQRQLVSRGGVISTVHAGTSSGTALSGSRTHRFTVQHTPIYHPPSSSTSTSIGVRSRPIERPAGPTLPINPRIQTITPRGGTSTFHSAPIRGSMPTGIRPLTTTNHQ